jgi:hypothetical protein
LLLTQLLVQYVRGSSVSVVKDKKPSPWDSKSDVKRFYAASIIIASFVAINCAYRKKKIINLYALINTITI